jgi:hypothetical protein
MYPQGRMSHHFREMRVGDYLSVKGPKVKFPYVYLSINHFWLHLFLFSFCFPFSPYLEGHFLVSKCRSCLKSDTATRVVSSINPAKLEHLACLLEALELLQCSKYVWKLFFAAYLFIF